MLQDLYRRLIGAFRTPVTPKRKRRVHLAWAFVVAATCIHVRPPRAAAETLTFPADADVYVQSSTPNTNYEGATHLKADADPTRIIYLRFTVAGLAGRTVESARLLLDVTGPSDSGGTLHSVSSTSWSASSVTFDTRPAIDGGAVDTLGAVARGDVAEFSLDGSIGADGGYAFAIDSASGDGVSYRPWPGTDGNPPRLVLTVADEPAPPEPDVASVLEFAPDADAYVDVSKPNTNFGDDDELRIDANVERSSYLRFHVNGVGGRPVEKARLRLEASRTTVLGGAIHLLGSATWSENTITYASRPPIDTPVIHTLGAVSPGDVVEFVLDGAITGDGTYDLAIDSPSSDGFGFHSSEAVGGQRPVLELTLGDASGPAPNTPPELIVTSPVDGATILAGETVSLAATATDSEDGSLDDAIVWTSSLDGLLGIGPSLTVTLSIGDHVLSASVSDSAGAPTSHSLAVSVSDGAPTTMEMPPVADAYVDSAAPSRNYGDNDELRVDANVERMAYLRFAVSGTGGREVAQAHLRIQASRTSVFGGTLHLLPDSAWEESTITYDNRPTDTGVSLDSIGAVGPGDVVELDLGAAITGDGVYDFRLDSTSSDGVGYHSSESTTGEPPTLVLTLTGESGGGSPGPPSGSAPVLTLSSPADQSIFAEGDSITLGASANDAEDGSLEASIVWTSSLDGILGMGSPLTVSLSPGSHEITAAVTDSDGLEATASVSVLVDGVVVLEFTPTQDVYVDAKRPTNNYGASSILRADANVERISYLRFNVEGVGASRVLEGTLRLQVDDSSSAASDNGGSVHLTSGPWDENLVTYEARPAVTGSPLDSAGPVEELQFVDFDVTEAVRVGDGARIFALVSPSSDGVNYRSRESSTPPKLILTVAGPTEAGAAGVTFGPGVDVAGNRATESKPESKLWHNDGLWWATLFNPAGVPGHRIHAFDPVADAWIDTGVLVDERAEARQDVLWTGQKLYAASRASLQNRLYRFSYDATGPVYTLDAGFPVDIPGAGAESINVAQDSTGKLWIAYSLAGQVFVAHSESDDATWAAPFVVPVAEGTTVSADDIAGVQAIDGAVGVFWSNQIDERLYFAVHADGQPTNDPASWDLEIAAEGGNLADDHFNLKLASDGRLFAVVKTSYHGFTSPLAGLLVRSPAGAWSPLYEVAPVQFLPNRPQCLLDETAGLVYVFYSVDSSGIYFKTSPLDAIAFEEGMGTPLAESAIADDINGPTTTKQLVDDTTGIVVVGASEDTQTYWHGTLGLP